MSMTVEEAIAIIEDVTWNGCGRHYGKIPIAREMAILALEEIQQYRAIGTVSEFQQLREKATAKKIVVKGVMGFDGEESFCCPNCGLDISQWGYGVCIDCGQKLLY